MGLGFLYGIITGALFVSLILVYFLGTVIWILIIGFLILIFFAKKVKKLLINQQLSSTKALATSAVLYLVINLIPYPLPGSTYGSFSSEESSSIAIGWPMSYTRYFLEDRGTCRTELCGNSIDKIHKGLFAFSMFRVLFNIPIMLLYLLLVKKYFNLT